MLGACGGRLTAVERTLSSIRFVASDFVFVLLTRTLTSSTFKLALMCIAVFTATIFALLGYVYRVTTDYVHDRNDRAISADRKLLVETYGEAGRDSLVILINQWTAGRGFGA